MNRETELASIGSHFEARNQRLVDFLSRVVCVQLEPGEPIGGFRPGTGAQITTVLKEFGDALVASDPLSGYAQIVKLRMTKARAELPEDAFDPRQPLVLTPELREKIRLYQGLVADYQSNPDPRPVHEEIVVRSLVSGPPHTDYTWPETEVGLALSGVLIGVAGVQNHRLTRAERSIWTNLRQNRQDTATLKNAAKVLRLLSHLKNERQRIQLMFLTDELLKRREEQLFL